MRKKLNLLGLIAVSAFIAYKSLAPVPAGKPATGFVPLHFLAYAVLGGAFLINLHDRDRMYLEAFAAAFFFGFGIELIQGTLSYRFFGWNDVLMNFLGASVVLLDRPVNLIDHVVSFQDFVVDTAAEKTGL
ncbi:MAG: VanZ family protein [Candidatus Nanohalobium sp.]